MPRSRRFSLAGILVAAGLLGGCAASAPTSSEAPSRPPASVLVLPSATQQALAAESGIPSAVPAGRGDEVLGGAVTASRGPSIERVDVRSEQRLLNGRVYGTLRWRSRSIGTSSR